MQAELKYKIQDLGTLQSDCSRTAAINEAGQVAGYYTWKGEQYVFFWDGNEGLMTLDVPIEHSFEILHFHANTNMIWGITRNAKSKQAIGMSRWEPSGGYLLYPPRFKAGDKLKEILNVTKSHCIIGISQKLSGQEFYFRSSGDEAQNLPLLYGDLGLPSRISQIVGSDQNIVVANCLYPLVNKGEVVKQVERSFFWKCDQGWKVNKLSNSSYHSITALCMNNNRQVICETNEGWLLIDLKNGTEQDIRKFDSVRSFNNKGYFITNQMNLVETVVENGMLGKIHLNFGNPDVIVNMSDGDWKKICAVNGINDAGHVIGEAETKFGEVHAILLLPVYTN